MERIRRYGKDQEIWKGLEDMERIRRFGKNAEIWKWLGDKERLKICKKKQKTRKG